MNPKVKKNQINPLKLKLVDIRISTILSLPVSFQTKQSLTNKGMEALTV